MWLAALAPTLSRALAVGAGGPRHPPAPERVWVELCGPGGARWVALPADVVAQARGVWHEVEHALGSVDACALCGLSLDRGLPDAGMAGVVPRMAGRPASPSGTAPPPRTAWPDPWSARGPPPAA
jgi:hypothetical protein